MTAFDTSVGTPLFYNDSLKQTQKSLLLKHLCHDHIQGKPYETSHYTSSQSA